jgi:hypothetical protein
MLRSNHHPVFSRHRLARYRPHSGAARNRSKQDKGKHAMTKIHAIHSMPLKMDAQFS